MKREKWVVMGLLLALLLALAACSSAQVSELAPTVEAADEPTGDQTFETEASLIVEMDDDDAL